MVSDLLMQIDFQMNERKLFCQKASPAGHAKLVELSDKHILSSFSDEQTPKAGPNDTDQIPNPPAQQIEESVSAIADLSEDILHEEVMHQKHDSFQEFINDGDEHRL